MVPDDGVGLFLPALIPLLVASPMLIESAFRILQPTGRESALLTLAVIIGRRNGASECGLSFSCRSLRLSLTSLLRRGLNIRKFWRPLKFAVSIFRIIRINT